MIEKDPKGLDAHAPGAKLDAGKQRPWLVLGEFARALKKVVAVGTFGATKYTDSGWKHVDNGVERYMEAAMRHMLDLAAGEQLDPQTKLHHKAHAAWNLLASLDLELRALEQVKTPPAPPPAEPVLTPGMQAALDEIERRKNERMGVAVISKYTTFANS